MCGIAGIFMSMKDPEARVRNMLNMIEHRGPDGIGLDHGYLGKNKHALSSVVGAARLAILDREHGIQPQITENGKYSLVMNGEIYNYHFLNSKLNENIKLKSYCDTETALHILSDKGIEGLSRLHGAFALAFRNRHTGTVLLARDPMGIKPLYIMRVKGEIAAFCSEWFPLYKLAEDAGLPQSEIDRDALRKFLVNKYISGPDTLISGIEIIPRGTWVRIGTTGETWGKFHSTINSYGKAFKTSIRNSVGKDSLKHNAGLLKRALEAAVQDRLRSDMPVGLMLSGGIDSSAIAACLPKNADVTTLIMVPESSQDTDDINGARAVASHFSLKKIEVPISPEDYIEWLEDGNVDVPVGDPGMISLWKLSQYARKKGIGVLLNGAGSDEIFGGYDFCHRARIFEQAGYEQSGALERFAGIFSSIEADRLLDIESSYRSLQNQLKKSYSNSESKRFRDIVNFVGGAWLTDYQLLYSDYMSMLSSVELRVPFMDFRVVSIAGAIPDFHLNDGVSEKFLLRFAFSEKLPEGQAWEKKRPFSVPIDQWLRRELKCCAEERLNDLKDMSIFKNDEISRIWNSHIDEKNDNGARIWSLLTIHKFFLRMKKGGAF